MAPSLAEFSKLIPIHEVAREHYLDEDDRRICVDIDNRADERKHRAPARHSGVYSRDPYHRPLTALNVPHIPASVYWYTQQTSRVCESASAKYSAQLEFVILWNTSETRWEHYMESLEIEKDLTRNKDDWGVISRYLYATNSNNDPTDPLAGEWIHEDLLCGGTYATAWSRSGFWRALQAECRAAGGEVVYQDAEQTGQRCHILFLVDSSKSMSSRDLVLEDRRMRRIDGAVLMLKEFAQNDPGQGCDMYTAILVSDAGEQVICKQSSARQLLDCLETCSLEPKHGASYTRVVECIRTLSDVRERTRVIFLSDARPGDAGPYLTFYCQFLSWLNANCKVLPLDTLQVYTIGLQEAQFEILQQMATLGNGMYLPCQSSVTSLRTAFATVSRTITQRRQAAAAAADKQKALADAAAPVARFKRQELGLS